ncbi:MAG: ABC transporter ATP-binding protein [Catalinimonas sp.]
MTQASLHVEHLGKRYQRTWIFRDLTHTFEAGRPCAVVGPNGAGKSTLIQTLTGYLSPSAGELRYRVGARDLPPEAVHRHVAVAAPYLELIEEMTLLEAVRFHGAFRPLGGLSPRAFTERIFLDHARHQYVGRFSSGMKQRLKLGLALFTDAPLLLLDEPTANLDADGVAWYRREVTTCLPNRVVIIASNQPHEYDFCPEQIDVTTLKPRRPAG